MATLKDSAPYHIIDNVPARTRPEFPGFAVNPIPAARDTVARFAVDAVDEARLLRMLGIER